MPAAFITTQQSPDSFTAITSTASFTDPAYTTTKPTGGILFDSTLTSTSDYPSLMNIQPVHIAAGGTAPANNLTGIQIRVIGWSRTMPLANTANLNLYCPVILAELTPSYATTPNLFTSFYDATGTQYSLRTFSGLVSSTGLPAPSLYSPATTAAANKAPATAVVDLLGSQIIQVQAVVTSAQGINIGIFWSNM